MKVDEVGTAAGPSGLDSPSLIIALKPQGVSSGGVSFLLRRGDDDVAFGHGDFLQ